MNEVQNLQRDGKAAEPVELDVARQGAAPVSTTTRFDIAGAAEDNDAERNSVFTSLVTSDTDVVGLVAYSIYKQNKHDFLVAYARARGREPSEGELSAYIIGEATPRRLAIYRHLANATLEGRGPDVQVAAGSGGGGLFGRGAKSGGAQGKLLWLNLALLVALFAYLVFRFGLR
ncbi:MAG: uncharacterized protein JWN93_862 [Hyphomicrobiales bacterium]|nr:uncharacterized protein [Hyphomicrobiales bacterium]